MSSDPRDRVRDLFHVALALAPSARHDFLKTACGDDHSLFDEVWQLVDVHQEIETVPRPAADYGCPDSASARMRSCV